MPEFPARSPKELRHGYGVHAISSDLPVNMLSKWIGHATLEVTATYVNALHAQEQSIAARMWGQKLP
jgi:integrase